MKKNYDSTWPLSGEPYYEITSNKGKRIYTYICSFPDHYITQSQKDFCDICGGQIPDNYAEYETRTPTRGRG